MMSTGSSSGATSALMGATSRRRSWLSSRRAIAALIGVLFPLGFVVYGVGFSLVTNVTSAQDFLTALPAQQQVLVLGAFLMLLNTPIDIGKAILFAPILKRHAPRVALTYLAAMIVEVTFLTIGVLCLLMLVPLAAQTGAGSVQLLGTLAVQANGIAYQLGELALGCGALFLCGLLFRVRLIPRLLAGWGVLGYLLLIAGSIAEIFGVHISLALSIPGGLFEVVLGLWLIIRGFRPDAYGEAS